MSPAVAEIRRSGIGSSEIAGVVGLSPWSDPFSVYVSKTGEIQRAPESPRMTWGTRLQRAIAEGFSAETGLPHVWADYPVRSSLREWQLSSPDAIIATKPQQVLEAKSVALDQAKGWGDSGTDTIPDHYMVQVQWQLSTLDLETAWVACLIAGNDFRTYRIERNREIEDILLAEAESFWRNHVLARVPPPIGSSAAAAEYLRQRFPKNIEALRPPTDAELPVLREYAEVRASFDLLEDKKTALENRLKLACGDAEGIDGWFTWRKSKDSEGVNYEQMAIEYLMTLPPDVRAEVQKKYTGVVRQGARKFLWKGARQCK